MKKIHLLIFFFLLVLTLNVYSDTDYLYYLTKNQGDLRYCMQNGNCNLSNLNVINTTIVNENVTGTVNAYGFSINSTSLYDIFVPHIGTLYDLNLGSKNFYCSNALLSGNLTATNIYANNICYSNGTGCPISSLPYTIINNATEVRMLWTI